MMHTLVGFNHFIVTFNDIVIAEVNLLRARHGAQMNIFTLWKFSYILLIAERELLN